MPRSALTENTRVSYPIDYIANARIPCVGPHPKNIILLCCDAFGVLPPVSRLTTQQAMYHFISGYTAKARPSCPRHFANSVSPQTEVLRLGLLPEPRNRLLATRPCGLCLRRSDVRHGAARGARPRPGGPA